MSVTSASLLERSKCSGFVAKLLKHLNILKRVFNVEQSVKYSPSILLFVFFSCETHKSVLLIARAISCVKGRAECSSSVKRACREICTSTDSLKKVTQSLMNE